MKNGTPATSHWSRTNRAQSGCIGRAVGPDSPPIDTTINNYVTHAQPRPAA
jgi:hypothetical protein